MAEFAIQDQPIKMVDSINSAGAIQHFKELSVGAGSTLFKANAEGVFAGGTDYSTAPWALDYTGIQYVGANGEITLDAPNKTIKVNTNKIIIDGVNSKITVGSSNEVILDGVAGTVTTNKILDSTYGYYGVFVKTLRFASGGGNTTKTIGTSSGGLLNVTLNYTTGSDASYKLLPGFNTGTLNTYYNISKSGGNYILNINMSTIEGDISGINYYYVSAFFNSIESNGW